MTYVWIEPELCEPPHRVTHPQIKEWLVEEFKNGGWKKGTPALLGYKMDHNKHIQLISGSHRWAAAMEVGIKIPVVINCYSYVDKRWGTEAWVKMIRTPPLVT